MAEWRTTFHDTRARTMDPTHRRRHLHDHDREPAIWLDAVRPPDQRSAWLVDRFDPGRIQHFRRTRDLADADRGLDRRPPRRSARAEIDGGLRRDSDRGRLDRQFESRHVVDALSRRGAIRHRRRRGLRDCRWAGGEVVPRPSRARRRFDRRRFRRRRRPHGGSNPLCDRLQRLPDRVLLVRSRARRRRVNAGVAVARAGSRRNRRHVAHGAAQGDAIGAQLHAGTRSSRRRCSGSFTSCLSWFRPAA